MQESLRSTTPLRPGRVTIRDVAGAAGVSPSTVSKTMNNSGNLTDSTRARVRAVAERMSYRPDAHARTLRGSRSGAIGVLTDDREGVFATAILRGLEQVAAHRDFSLFLCHTLGEAERERRHIHALMDRRVDGIILLDGVVARRSAPSADTGSIPLVFLYCYTDSMDIPSIVPDDRGGAELAVDHLASLGRRRIAHISGPRTGATAWQASTSRMEGYQASLRRAGLPFDSRLLEESDWTEGSGYLATHRLFDGIPPTDRPDAIFCSNDYVAMGALEALRSLGLRAPDDVALVGFDDRSIAADASVPLTSVAIDHAGMGTIAIERLLSALDGTPQTREVISVPCELRIRQSTVGPQPESIPSEMNPC